MQCDYFDAGLCRSCTLMGAPYAAQLADKQSRAEALLAEALPAEVAGSVAWEDPVASREDAFRNRAKMAVSGRTGGVTLGVVDPRGVGTDLVGCGVHAEELQAALPVLSGIASAARLVPYDIVSGSGELRQVLVTVSPDGELLVRFVLRSRRHVPDLRRLLPQLRSLLPAARVVTANIHPEHKAVLEGDTEIVLTRTDTLPMRVGDLTLHLLPQSFFQTNTAVAEALYAQARAWAGAPHTAWDLFCGVGGFALHLAAPGRRVTGIETSADAVASATRTAADQGLDGTEFLVADASAWAVARLAGTDAAGPRTDAAPDLIVVNPPRRGLDADLTAAFESSARRVLYSSCNPVTLARDLARMPSLRPARARLFDMFPQTGHCEVMVELTRP